MMRLSCRIERNIAYVTKLAAFQGRKVSNPLNNVIIPVETKASHAPHGWKGALYGKSSLERPRTSRAFMNRLGNINSHSNAQKALTHI